jgi:hypothetical protein
MRKNAGSGMSITKAQKIQYLRKQAGPKSKIGKQSRHDASHGNPSKCASGSDAKRQRSIPAAALLFMRQLHPVVE